MIDSMTRDDVLSELGEISKHFESCMGETYGSIHEMFHRWMNAADWAAAYLNDPAPTVGGWISVKDDLPSEHDSIFANHAHLSKHLWTRESDNVIVYVRFPDGTGRSTEGRLQDGKWWTRISPTLEPVVTHWMPFPEAPQEREEG